MPPTALESHRRLASVMLLIASLFWGLGFTWSKQLGDAINLAAKLPTSDALGPTALLAGRFVVASALWLAIFPQARRGWSWKSVGRGGLIGGLMWVSVEVQHLGLARSNAATVAFLTNLTVVFVPLILAVWFRRWPHPSLAAAVVVAVAGIALLPAGGYGNLSGGEWLGAACAIGFSLEIIALGALTPHDSPYRLTAMMFITCAILSIATTAALPGATGIDPAPLLTPPVVAGFVLLTVLVTCVAYGLMYLYQPRLDPSRAAVIYLSEPVFAAAFAWAVMGETMTPAALCGAGLILVANLIAEVRWPKRRRMID